jgi:hypothetical protein
MPIKRTRKELNQQLLIVPVGLIMLYVLYSTIDLAKEAGTINTHYFLMGFLSIALILYSLMNRVLYSLLPIEEGADYYEQLLIEEREWKKESNNEKNKSK